MPEKERSRSDPDIRRMIDLPEGVKRGGEVLNPSVAEPSQPGQLDAPEMYRKHVEETPTGGHVLPVVQRAVDILAREMKPRKIILFGSAARGEADAQSDIDLLLVVDRFESRFQEMNRANDLLSRLKVPVDVLVYTTAEVEKWGDVVNHIVNEALLDGRVVYDAA